MHMLKTYSTPMLLLGNAEIVNREFKGREPSDNRAPRRTLTSLFPSTSVSAANRMFVEFRNNIEE